MSPPYHIPIERNRIETKVANSRFIATVDFADTAENAKAFIASIREEMPDASHHVYAFRAGFGNSVIEGVSDDGEPSGTSGPPILSILRGSNIGDIVIVVTRYFGGTKLGTGGLVRAYSEAANIALNSLKIDLKIEYKQFLIDVSYSNYENTKLLLAEYDADILEEEFTSSVLIQIKIPAANTIAFTRAIIDLTAGQSEPLEL